MGAAAAAAKGIDSYFSQRQGQTPKPPASPASPKTPSENPIDNPSAYDFIEIAGMKTPGLCKLTGCDRAYDWKVNAAHGSDGASTTLTGVGVIQPSFELTLWEPEHFVAWETLERILYDSIRGDKAKALSAHHPEMARKGFGALSIKKVGQLIPKPGGVSTVKVDVLEFKPPKPKAASTLSDKNKKTMDYAMGYVARLKQNAYDIQQQSVRLLENQTQVYSDFETVWGRPPSAEEREAMNS